MSSRKAPELTIHDLTSRLVFVAIVEWIVRLVALYLAAGVVFAIPFLAVGVGRIDPGAVDGTLGFKFIVFPGVVAFWPLLLKRWIAGQSEPPAERSSHRCTSIGHDTDLAAGDDSTLKPEIAS